MVSALVARSIMWRAWRGELQYRIERVSRGQYHATWATCPRTHAALVNRLNQE